MNPTDRCSRNFEPPAQPAFTKCRLYDTPKTSAELAASETIKLGVLNSTQMRELADKVEASEKLAAEKQARADLLDYHLKLANATCTLIYKARTLDKGTSYVEAVPEFADFRKELSPLAATYGYKIVLVGDKTRATLSR